MLILWYYLCNAALVQFLTQYCLVDRRGWRWYEEGNTVAWNLCTWDSDVHCPEEQQETKGFWLEYFFLYCCHVTFTVWVKKHYTWLLIITSADVNRFKILSLSCYWGNVLHYVIQILHLTLTMFLHYLVKLENWNCCWFQWHIACETSEFILQDVRMP